MQTLGQIRDMLAEAGLTPRKAFGQNFLIDQNLMGKFLELADVRRDQTVLEVGPGTGSLTEELLFRAGKVVAVEIDRGLCGLLRRRLGEHKNLVLIEGDVLSGKHAMSPAVLEAVGPAVSLVSNLPYNIATPLLAQCLVSSWRAAAGRPAPPPGKRPRRAAPPPCLFERLTFTVQKEVAERLLAGPDSKQYGPVSVLTSLLGSITQGPAAPPSAFWPEPKVASRMLRIDFRAASAGELLDVEALTAVVNLAFAQRRKQIGSIVRRKGAPFAPEALAAAMEAAEIDPSLRAENIAPREFLLLANALAAPAPADPT